MLRLNETVSTTMTKDRGCQEGKQVPLDEAPLVSKEEETPLLGNKKPPKRSRDDLNIDQGEKVSSSYARASSYDDRRTASNLSKDSSGQGRHKRGWSDWTEIFGSWPEQRADRGGRPGITRSSRSAVSTFHLDEDVHAIHVVERGGPEKQKGTGKHSRHTSDVTWNVDNRQTTVTNLVRSRHGTAESHPVVTIDVEAADWKRPRFHRDRICGTIFFIFSYVLFIAYSFTVVFGPLLLLLVPKSEWCSDYVEDEAEARQALEVDAEYSNPDYITDPCRYERIPRLGWLTLEECDISRRMLTSVVLGGIIGYERRSADRPAGIRTMGLVSLGSCFFTISSIMAFKSSTMGWDSSRVTAAIPSGVGFLGAGLIWKGAIGVGDNEMHQVHGLTTAASVWLSAAIGVGSGGALYFVSVYSTILILLVLRYGPKLYLQEDGAYRDEDEDETSSEEETQFKEDAAQTGGEIGDHDKSFAEPADGTTTVQQTWPDQPPMVFRHSAADIQTSLLTPALHASHVSFSSERRIRREASRKRIRKRKGWGGPSFVS